MTQTVRSVFATVAVTALLATGCGGGEDASQAFTDAITVQNGTRREGAIPNDEGSSGLAIPAINQSSAPSIRPGDTFTITVPYSGGQASAVNVGFGGDSYFEVPVNQSGTSGTVQITITVSSSLSLEEAAEVPCIYSVSGSDGSASPTEQTEIVACTQGGVCTPGEGDEDDGDDDEGGSPGAYNCSSAGLVSDGEGCCAPSQELGSCSGYTYCMVMDSNGSCQGSYYKADGVKYRCAVCGGTQDCAEDVVNACG